MCSEHGGCLLVLVSVIIETIKKADMGLSEDDIERLADNL